MSRTVYTPPAEALARFPLFQLAVAFSGGVLVSTYFVVSIRWLIAAAVVLSLVALFTLVTNRKRVLATIMVMLAFSCTGASVATIENSPASLNQLKRLIETRTIRVGEPVELTGVLERDPEIAPERLYLQLRVHKIRSRDGSDQETRGLVMLLVSVPNASVMQELDQLDLHYGARLRVMTRLERADNFRNPGVASFTEYLDQKGYDASGFVKSPLLIERLENDRVLLPLAWLYGWRGRLQREIDAHFSAETAGVLDAAMLGNRYRLSRSTAERFREGGTFHALVISGLHITFLGGFAFLLARSFTRNKLLQFLLSATVLWAYALAVGAEASVARAAFMFTLIILAPLVSRRAASLNVLGGTALALLAIRPSSLFDPSFQLTFISVLAMVAFSWPLLERVSSIGSWRPSRQTPYPPGCAVWLRTFCECLYWSEREGVRELEHANYNYRLFKSPLAKTLERIHLQRLLRYAFGAIVVSTTVQLALLPFLIIYFHRLSLASFVLNIGVSLMLGAVALLAAIALILAQFSATLAAPLIHATNGLNWLTVHSVDPFARLGVASIRIPEYSGWAAISYGIYFLPLATITLLIWRWHPLGPPQSPTKKNRLWIALACQLFTIMFLIVHPGSEGQATGKLRIDFLDVGQGDAALVTFPDNTTLLVDAGGQPGPFPRARQEDDEEVFERETRSIGEAVVSEYLWWRGLDHVDYLLATHADSDHIDGLNDVARNFRVQAAFVARTPKSDPEYSKFDETLTTMNIPLHRIGAGDILRFGEVTASVLWPKPFADSSAPSRNNDSVVLRFQFGSSVVLLTGDIERAGEFGLLQAPQNLHADVVKVAHHGSKTSSTKEMVAATHARYAIISVGQMSIFGHPHTSVVERWQSSGAQVLTTGKSGTITVTTDGRELNVETFVK